MKTRKHRMKMTVGEKIFTVVNGTILALFFIITLYPMIYVVSASFSDPAAVANGTMVLWPVGPTLKAYEMVLQYKNIWIGYANTIFYTVAGTLLNMAFTLPCAYALSRKDLQGRGIIMALFIITMYFSGGMIPGYLNMNSFGLINTRTSLLVYSLVSVYNMIVARTFFMNTIPWELQEAAYLDGCSTFKLFARIILPLSAPIIVVLALYYGVGHWNSYFNALIYLKDRSKFPLQVFLREILIKSQNFEELMAEGGLSANSVKDLQSQLGNTERLKYAVIVVSAAPMMAVYPWLQKYFAKGVMIGSVKG